LQQVSHRELVANAHNLIVGGSETTATSLAGAIYLLVTNKPVLEKLYKEVRNNFESENDIDLISVQKLQYMFAVLHEGLRIYPAVPAAIPRRTSVAAMVGKHYVPADVGASVLFIVQRPLTHMNNADNHWRVAVAHISQPELFQRR
jgi:cytochrome P450